MIFTSEREKQIHTAYCDYQITKGNKPSRIYTVKAPQKKPQIRTFGLSKAVLAQQLASLY